jgi:anti-sigma B factor antagonist
LRFVLGGVEFGLLDESVSESVHVVSPSGEIDMLTAPQLGRRILSLFEEGKTRLVVDLSKVTFMDSSGIGVILDALRRLKTRRGSLVLVCPSERILRPFEITGLVGYLKIFGTREEALGAVAV